MAGRKVDLATLGGRVKVEPAPEAEPVVEAVPAPRASRRRPKSPAPGEWVRFDELERKETRLRADQYGQLSEMSRGLNRARGGAGERITENTLIRVAIDLLLTRQGELAGVTEVELRKSVGL